MNWSDASSNCRVEWRPSRWMIAMLAGLVVAACVSLWLSNLPPRVVLVAQCVVAGYGLWLVVRELRRPPASLAWPGADAPWQVATGERVESLAHVAAAFRGGLVVLVLREEEGERMRRYVWWPDTLDAPARRILRLAAASAARGDETARADA